MKLCTKCKKLKTFMDFRKNKNVCKTCQKIYDKIYRKNNKEQIKIRGKKYRKTHSGKIKQCRENRKEEKKIQDKIYNETNKEKLKEKRKLYRKENNEKIKISKKITYKKNKNKINKKRRLDRKQNIKKYLFYSAKRRAKEKQLDFNLTLDDIKVNELCPLLNIEIKPNEKNSYNSITIDRLNSKKGYVVNNIWTISKKANTSKNDSTIEEYERIVNNLNSIVNKKITIIGGGSYDKIQRRLYDKKSLCKKNNIPFNLDKEYLKSIYPKNNKCPLLNIEFEISKNYPKNNCASLDRIIPGNGYVKGNVMFISYRANRIKSNLSLNEMKLLLKNWKRYYKYILSHFRIPFSSSEIE